MKTNNILINTKTKKYSILVGFNIIKNIYTLAKKNECKIIIPVDCNISSNVNGDRVYKSLKDISKNWSLEKKFTPKMKNDYRKSLLLGWSKAIKRALIN